MLTKVEGLKKLQQYCAYQERCHSEVRNKLIELKIYGDLLEEIISELIKEDFLNEERFARLYAGGKFRIKKWGRTKIIQNLKKKSVSEYCIRKGMEEIDAEDYLKTLSLLIDKSWARYDRTSKSTYETKKKTIVYLQNRGYEYQLINEIIAQNYT